MLWSFICGKVRHHQLKLSLRSFSSTRNVDICACIIGSGPAGFYTTENILKRWGNRAKIDIYERLPTPFGLVRSGVAPDHPEVKSVTKKFEQLASDPRCTFVGNVEVGKDITIKELNNCYNVIIFAYGASTDRYLQIPGEDLPNVHSARDFVGWFNGHPDYRSKSFNMSGDTCVIIGQGNVALDVARILLKPTTELQHTDIASHALEELQKSNIQEVHIVGRRGPAQMSFTPKELREALSITNCTTYINESEVILNEASQEEVKMNRSKKRILDLLQKRAVISFSRNENQHTKKSLFIHFLLSPLEIVNGVPKSILFARNTLQGKPNSQVAVPTEETISLSADLIFRSIGYRSIEIPGVPFDSVSGIVPNERGRVIGHPGWYVSGWLKRGPTGIIGTNKWCAEETVDAIWEDSLSEAIPLEGTKSLGYEGIHPLLENRNAQAILWNDWKKIDAHELERGSQFQKVREKVTLIPEMLDLVSKKQGMRVGGRGKGIQSHPYFI